MKQKDKKTHKSAKKRSTACAAAVLLCAALLQSLFPETGFASEIGPGILNLSPADTYAVYQWGLKNDGKLGVERSALKKDAFQELYQSYREWAASGGIGIPPRTPEPSDFSHEIVRAAKGIDIKAAEAFARYRADQAAGADMRDVVVAVIDTGIDTEHLELKDALWVNADETPGDGIDNDGNGYIDDVNGYNFFDGSPRVRDNKLADLHGTHAAGTIAAKWGNGGTAGLTDNAHVKIMVLKALDEDGGGTEQSVINAIRYAEANGASICNLSLGGTEAFPELESVIKASKMLFVVAAGNGDEKGKGYDTDAKPVYPAAYPEDNIISVANLNFTGELEESSNYGLESVDLAAPGTYILSTAPGNTFQFLTGTSMAAPMVTGVCAMVYSYRPEFSLQDVKEAVLATVQPLASLTSKVKTGGIPDLAAAMQYGRNKG